MNIVRRNSVAELCLCAEDTPAAVERSDIEAVVTYPGSLQVAVPAFWSQGMWKARFSSWEPGSYTWEARCTSGRLPGSSLGSGELAVTRETDAGLLYERGPVRVRGRSFEHADGSPFFWLGDTWWMGLSGRLCWPEFVWLAADRARKGFSVVQIVAGPYPDMEAFDERGKGEGGFSWHPGWPAINPAYYDYADRRIRALVDAGLVPCIVGAWGYHLRSTGIDKMKLHWRNLSARYGALPVVWCLAGEAAMPFYNSESKEEDSRFQKEGWTEVATYVREIDAFRRPVTIHPRAESAEEILDRSLLDFEMLQTGHSDRLSLQTTVETCRRAFSREPAMPVVNAEVCYEGIGQACPANIQRLMFWASMLSGASGFTYGANGLWQINRRDAPYGASPHGFSWGGPDWEEASQLPGACHLCAATKALEHLLEGLSEPGAPAHLEPHPEWIANPWSPANPGGAFAAGIPEMVRVMYWPSAFAPREVLHLEPGVRYKAVVLDPISGSRSAAVDVCPDESGRWQLTEPPPAFSGFGCFQDWVLVLRRP